MAEHTKNFQKISDEIYELFSNPSWEPEFTCNPEANINKRMSVNIPATISNQDDALNIKMPSEFRGLFNRVTIDFEGDDEPSQNYVSEQGDLFPKSD